MTALQVNKSAISVRKVFTDIAKPVIPYLQCVILFYFLDKRGGFWEMLCSFIFTLNVFYKFTNLMTALIHNSSTRKHS